MKVQTVFDNGTFQVEMVTYDGREPVVEIYAGNEYSIDIDNLKELFDFFRGVRDLPIARFEG